MLTKYNIYCDLHYFGANELDVKPEETGENCILLGDIVDISHCLYDNLKRAKSLITSYRLAFGDNYIAGNHEQASFNDFLLKNNILFTHGDFLQYDYEEAMLLRTSQEGISKFNFFIKKILTRVTDFFGGAWVTEEFKERAVFYANKYQVKKIVIGHMHHRYLEVYKIDDIKLYVCPRGHTELFL